MTVFEIILLILGIAVYIANFFIPVREQEESHRNPEVEEEKVKEIIDEHIKEAKEQMQDVLDETMTYSVEKTERSLERISNDKINAISEFSETVLSDIHKSHEEVMFLYDMLHDKQKNIHETVVQVNETNEKAKETQSELEVTKQELKEAKTELEEVLSFVPMEPVDVDANKERVIEPVAKKAPKSTKEVEELFNERVKALEEKKSGNAPKKSKAKAGPLVETGGSMNNNERILELHKKGKSNVAIAKELGLGVGEVKLVIDLFEVM